MLLLANLDNGLDSGEVWVAILLINIFVAFRKVIRSISTNTHTLGNGPNIPIKVNSQSVISMPSGRVGSLPGL